MREPMFVYSIRSTASLTPFVPRLTASIASAPTLRVQRKNSFSPNVFGSIERQARSSRAVRASNGPMPSCQS